MVIQMIKDTFKYQTSVDVAELTRYLSALVEGLENGVLSLKENDHAFSIHPRGLVDLSFKVRHKNGLTRVGLEMAWAEDEIELPLLAGPQAEQQPRPARACGPDGDGKAR